MAYEKQTWVDLPDTSTPITAEKMNHIEKGIAGIDAHKYFMKITNSVAAGVAFTIPCYYKVGQEVLDVYLNGERLLLSSDDAGTNGHYREVGQANSVSNQIKTTTDWNLGDYIGDVFEFVVRGEYSV